MKILSLFDGISCGALALHKANIPITSYRASEIDKDALKVSLANFPEISQLGDVTKLTNLGKVDLLLAGSPCQGFSFAGKGLNFNDPRSKLFFDFVRILKETSPTYFLLENVRMKKEYLNTISNLLGVEPICINSAKYSAQNRVRYYWTNIPYIENHPKDISLSSVIGYPCSGTAKRARYINGFNGATYQKTETRKDNKANTITTVQKNCRIRLEGKEEDRAITVEEAERLQTLPKGYTSAVSAHKAHKLIGNCWTVDVIAQLFRGIKPHNLKD